MKRPHISIYRHTYEDPPKIVVGKTDPYEYPLNQVTALHIISVLSEWLQFVKQKEDGPSYCLHGDL